MKILIYTIAMVNGFCMMSIEMIASKMMAPYFGNSITVWGSIISVFMISLASGAMIGGWISSHRSDSRILFYMLISLVLSLVLTLQVYEVFLTWIDLTSPSQSIKMILSCCVLFVPFSFVSGMISPFSIELLSKSNSNTGHNAGRLYFASTIASGIGVIVTSFYLVLIFSLESIFILNITLIIVMILIFAFFKGDKNLKYHYAIGD